MALQFDAVAHTGNGFVKAVEDIPQEGRGTRVTAVQGISRIAAEGVAAGGEKAG